jgi:hypothetical protein
VSARWRVVRQSSGGTGTDVCRHYSHRIAHWCARRYERREPIGVWFDVREVVKPC